MRAICWQLNYMALMKKTGQLKRSSIAPMYPTTPVSLTSTDSENHRFITFLNAYMQQGRDAVSTVDYQARKPFLSFWQKTHFLPILSNRSNRFWQSLIRRKNHA